MNAGEVERIMGMVREYGNNRARYTAAMARDQHARAEEYALAGLTSYTAIRSALLAVVPGWLPISEAPRDGRTILLFRTGSARVVPGYWSQADLSWVDTDGSLRDPSHYQPLPTPPAPGGEGE
jgi:hypothetical protein